MTKHTEWQDLPPRTRAKCIKEAASLLRHLGIELRDYNQSGSWGKQLFPHLKLLEGKLYVDLDKVTLGDLVHEASHILVVDSTVRSHMTGWLGKSNYWSYSDGGEEMTQAASYAICKTLGIDPWIAIRVACTQPLCDEMLKRLENSTHEGIKLLEEKGISKPGQFPWIFKSFRDFLKEISAQASPIGGNSVLVDDWYERGTKEYPYPKEFFIKGERYHWSMSTRSTRGRCGTHYELWGHGSLTGNKRYATGDFTKAKLFKFFRDIYEKVNL